jgi:transcriptional regulator with XRE-family HTH domain
MPPEPHHVDAHVGERLKQRRLTLGLSQERLGELLGLTFQQIQKYERGSNRLGASRLYQAACALDVEIAYFFDGLATNSDRLAREAIDELASADAVPALPSRDTLELVRAFERIGDPELRRWLLEITEAVAAADIGSGRGA